MQYVSYVAPTATEDGHEAYYYCSGCGKYFYDAGGNNEIENLSDVTIDATGEVEDDGKETHTHSLTHYDAVAATCTTAGNIEYWYCSSCKKYYSDANATAEITQAQTVIAATGHTYEVSWTWTGYASATATFTCTSNDETKTETATITNEIKTEATCTTDGEKVYTATVTFNGKTYTDTKSETLSATGHTLTHTDAVAATCTTAGNIEYWYCSDCEKYFSDEKGTTEITQAQTVIAATGHTYEVSWTWTGYASATATFTCTSNDETKTETATITNEVKTAATCTTSGEKVYTATVTFNDKTYTDMKSETLSATGHTLTHTDAVAATCTTAGNIGYWYCSDCQKYFSDANATAEITQAQTVIAATGHTYEVSWTWTGYASATATFTCTSNDETKTETATITNEVKTAATCTTDGEKVYTATVTFNDKTYIDTKSETLSATEHSYEAVVTEPTCTEGGYTTYTCSSCGDSYVADETEAAGHTYDSNGVCTVCGYENSTIVGNSYTIDFTALTYYSDGVESEELKESADSLASFMNYTLTFTDSENITVVVYYSGTNYTATGNYVLDSESNTFTFSNCSWSTTGADDELGDATEFMNREYAVFGYDGTNVTVWLCIEKTSEHMSYAEGIAKLVNNVSVVGNTYEYTSAEFSFAESVMEEEQENIKTNNTLSIGMTMTFNSDGTVSFTYPEAVDYMNSIVASMTNTYVVSGDTITITSVYQSQESIIIVEVIDSNTLAQEQDMLDDGGWFMTAIYTLVTE